jgi:hypothetical protein
MKNTIALVLKSITVLCFCLYSSVSFAQLDFSLPPHPGLAALDSIEYFFDADSGIASRNMRSITPDTVVADSIFVPVESLEYGVHQLFVRVRNANGSWSHSIQRSVYKNSEGLQLGLHNKNPIVAIEYFFNADPGHGNGYTILLETDSIDIMADVATSVAALSPGVYSLYIRVKDSQGNWSTTTRANLNIADASLDLPQHQEPDSIVLIEYFIDSDPGVGNAIQLPQTPALLVEDIEVSVHIGGLSLGNHVLFTRVIQQSQSIVQARVFSIQDPLPAFWISFTGIHNSNGGNKLNWRVSQDHDIAYYELEKYCQQGFERVAQIFKTCCGSYEYLDEGKCAEKVSLYRVKAVKVDGNVNYSPIVELHTADYLTGILISNPVHQQLRIYGIDAALHNAPYQIVDIAGKVVHQGRVPTAHNSTIDLSHLASGNYFISIVNGAESVKLQFVKL